MSILVYWVLKSSSDSALEMTFNLSCKKISKSVAAALEHNIFENLDSMAKDLGPPHSFEI